MIMKELVLAVSLLFMSTMAVADLYIEPLPAGYKPPVETGGNIPKSPDSPTQQGAAENSNPVINQSLNEEKEGEKNTEMK